MSFMKLVRPSELSAYDLPLVETPFLAADKARRLVEESGHARSIMHSVFRYGYRDGGNIAETVYRAVRAGELVLVCAGWRGPVSPMVTWQPDISLPAGGRWRVNGGWLYTSSAIESAVAQLNECGVPPDQLCQSDPWGLGALDATLFSTHTRQCQRQAAQGREDDHRLSLPLGASALVAPVLASASAAEEQHAEQELLLMTRKAELEARLRSLEHAPHARASLMCVSHVYGTCTACVQARLRQLKLELPDDRSSMTSVIG